MGSQRVLPELQKVMKEEQVTRAIIAAIATCYDKDVSYILNLVAHMCRLKDGQEVLAVLRGEEPCSG